MLRIDSAVERQIKNYGNIGVCSVFLICVFCFAVLFCAFEKKEFSDIENRELAKFPVLWDGEAVNGNFYMDLEGYFSDAFPFRDGFLQANRRIKTIYTAISFPSEDDGVVFIAADYGDMSGDPNSMASGKPRGDDGVLPNGASVSASAGDGGQPSGDAGGGTPGISDITGAGGSGKESLKYSAGASGGQDTVEDGTASIQDGANGANPADTRGGPGDGPGTGSGDGPDAGSGTANPENSVGSAQAADSDASRQNGAAEGEAGQTPFVNGTEADGRTAPPNSGELAASDEAGTRAASADADGLDLPADAGERAAATDNEGRIAPPDNEGRTAPPDDEGQTAPSDNEGRDETYEANESTGVSIVSGQAFEIFVFSESRTIAYAAVIDAIADECGIPAYLVTPPSASELFLPEKYRGAQNEQKPAFNLLKSSLKNVVYVDLYDAFMNAKDSYLYFRTDHHWTADGAYLAYREFMKATGSEPAARSAMTSGRLDGFLCSLYRQIYENRHSVLLEQTPDYVLYYEPIYETEVMNYNDADMSDGKAGSVLVPDGDLGANTYNVFFGGDIRLLYMHSAVANGRSIIVVRDSFGHAFLPFLANNYEHVYAVEPRYFDTFPLTQFIKDHKIGELLFLNHSILATGKYWYNWIPELAKLN